MTDCLSPDAMVAVGQAVDWNVPDAWRHLERCSECQARVEALRLARAGLMEETAIDPDVLRQVTTAVGAAAASVQARQGWFHAVEAALAGVAAVLVLISSGVQVDGPGTAALGFALGATLMAAGTYVAGGLQPAGRPQG